MLKATDGGSTWRRLDNGLDEDVHAVITDPSHLYISTDGEGMRPGKAPGRSLYRSFDVPELRRRRELAAHRYGVPERVLRPVRLRPG